MTAQEAGRHGPALPGEVAATTHPRRGPETRDSHSSTFERWGANLLTRRRLIQGAAGAGALLLTAGGSILYGRRDGGGTDARTALPAPPMTPPSPEASPSFAEKDLALNHITMPETLDAATFEDVVHNLGQAIQYAVNHNDIAGLRNYIPGGYAHVLQPDQFIFRAEFIKGYRGSSKGTINDNPHDPEDNRYYPWGFELELLELQNHHGEDPRDPSVVNFLAQVRLTLGDLPPLITPDYQDFPPIEPPQSLVTTAEFSRHRGLKRDGTYDVLPNLPGEPGRGWGLSNTGHMYPVPRIMIGPNQPEPSPLYRQIF